MTSEISVGSMVRVVSESTHAGELGKVVVRWEWLDSDCGAQRYDFKLRLSDGHELWFADTEVEPEIRT